jgi:uncharacterized protein YndB with AHSA1/START domain
MKVTEIVASSLADADVRKRTGKTLDDWYRRLDASGVAGTGRRAATEHLMTEHELDAWWAQTIAVEYERARGQKERDGRPKGYSICVTKSITALPEAVFDSFGRAEMLSQWRGQATSDFREKGAFRTEDGERGEFVKLARPKTLRFTWSSEAIAESLSLVELKLTPKGNGTALVLNHERIQSRALADGLREAWGRGLTGLKTYLERG